LEDSSYLLICSDGLSNKISKKDIAAIVLSAIPLSQKGEEMVKLANELGGEDNISFVLLSSKAEEV
jgi:protein phosphatase